MRWVALYVGASNKGVQLCSWGSVYIDLLAYINQCSHIVLPQHGHNGVQRKQTTSSAGTTEFRMVIG